MFAPLGYMRSNYGKNAVGEIVNADSILGFGKCLPYYDIEYNKPGMLLVYDMRDNSRISHKHVTIITKEEYNKYIEGFMF